MNQVAKRNSFGDITRWGINEAAYLPEGPDPVLFGGMERSESREQIESSLSLVAMLRSTASKPFIRSITGASFIRACRSVTARSAGSGVFM